MKINKLFLILLAFLITVSFSGCFVRIGIGGVRGNGNVVSQDRSAAGFTGIEINGAGNINIYQSENYKVTVTTDSNIQDIVEVKVSGSSLQISQKNNTGFNPTKFDIDVYLPDLKNITVNGAANIKIEDGKTSDLAISVAGAAKIDTRDYEVQNVNVDLAGAGEVTTWAVSTLNYKIAGVGTIRYKGSPTRDGSISGVGSIKPL
jgi:hypothetical protein